MSKVSGKRAFLEVLKQEGVSVMFGNPGTTELPLMDILATEDNIRYVLTLQEAVAMTMADGYARASGKLAVVNLHVAPGLGNAMGSLFGAHRAGSPVLVTAGQQAQGFGLTEPNLYAELPPIAEHFTKWSTEVRSAAELPRVIHRAAKIALTPPTGPVFVSLPGDVLNEDADIDLSRPTRVAPHFRADPQAVAEAAKVLSQAERPVIIAGDAVSQSFAHDELVRIAELLGAPVYLEGEATTNGFPTTHPLFREHLVRSAPTIRAVLKQHDVLFSVGADLFTLSLPPEVEPVPDGIRIVHLDPDPWQLAKNYPAEPAVMGDPKTTLPEIEKEIRRLQSPQQSERSKQRSSSIAAENLDRRQKLAAEAEAHFDATPIIPLSLMYAIGQILPANAVVIDETVSSGAGLREFLKCDGPDALYGVRGGGIGFGIPGAIGVKLALPDRPVVALVGDGSAMYTIQGLWTAANQQLPIVFVILKNESYRILKQRLSAMKSFASQMDRYVGMDLTNPSIDYVNLARSMGVYGVHVNTVADFGNALRTALSFDKPTLIEVAVSNQFKPI